MRTPFLPRDLKNLLAFCPGTRYKCWFLAAPPPERCHWLAISLPLCFQNSLWGNNKAQINLVSMNKLLFLIFPYFSVLALLTSDGSTLEYRVSAAKGPYFVCDDRVIEDRWLLDRVSPPLKKHPANPVMTKLHAWEGTGPMPLVAHYDTVQSLYRMWYMVWSPERYYGKQPIHISA